jgi:molybdenum cofactor guanylyltransferase
VTGSLAPVGLVLAGGRSSRMGRDKATLEVGGQLLVQGQIRTLRRAGIQDIFLSLPPEGPSPVPEIPVVRDRREGMGPLAGIVAGLEAGAPRPILVLAVDMPQVQPRFLRKLLDRSRSGVGVAPRIGDRWEPLCAIYPTEALALAQGFLTGDHRSPSALLDALQAAGLVEAAPVPSSSTATLKSWNRPDDLPEDVQEAHDPAT